MVRCLSRTPSAFAYRCRSCNLSGLSAGCPPPLPEDLRTRTRDPFSSAYPLKPVARFLQAYRQSAALSYPSPSRIRDRAAVRSSRPLPAVTRPVLLTCGFRRKKVSGLPGHTGLHNIGKPMPTSQLVFRRIKEPQLALPPASTGLLPRGLTNGSSPFTHHPGLATRFGL